MKKIALLLFAICAFAGAAWSKDLTPMQKRAQEKLYDYLDRSGFRPEIDVSDNSVCFRIDKVLYWITFDEESPILYTFNRKAYKIGTEDNQYHRDPAIIAANEVNMTHPGVKLTVGEKKVNIAIQVYMASPEYFTVVFKKYLSMFDGIDEDFKREYYRALRSEERVEDPSQSVKEEVKPDAQEKVKPNSQEEVNPEAQEEVKQTANPSILREYIESVSFQRVDNKGKVEISYGNPLESFNATYIQPKVEFKPWSYNPKNYTLYFKVTGPDGKPKCLDGKDYAIEQRITLERSKKKQTFETEFFGSDDAGVWKPGEYKVEILEGGDIIYTTTFKLY